MKLNRRGCAALGGCLLVPAAAASALLVWLVSRPLPFSGPSTGTVLDRTTGKPIAGASVEAKWEVADYPMIDGASSRWFVAIAATDEEGRFVLEPPRERAGLFRNEYRVLVDAEGHVGQVWLIPLRDYSAEMTFELEPDRGTPDRVFVESLPVRNRPHGRDAPGGR